MQVGYEELTINLWGTPVKIKVVEDWRVSIDPGCLKRLGKILNINVNISSNYGEYDNLMSFLTKTGLNFLELIDLKEFDFEKILDSIYLKTKTQNFKAVLYKLHLEFGRSSSVMGKNTVRYLLLRMREDMLDAVINQHYAKLNSDAVNLINKCYPFEKNPYISNFAGSKTSNFTVSKDVFRALGYEKANMFRPYLTLQRLIGETGEIYFKDTTIENIDEIKKFNENLDEWERKQGYRIKHESDVVFIESYENETLKILKSLVTLTQSGIKGQKALNKYYLKNSTIKDKAKKQPLETVFVNSRLLLIYGAAGTGKTTLIKFIAGLMENSKKLFLTKTHTALQNMRRSMNNVGPDSEFISLDSFTKRLNLPDYDVIFIDECSVIDNYTMARFFEKIGENTLLVLAGDIYQLEPIDFGNWFQYAKEIVNDSAKVELLNTWRTEENSLKDLWSEVRKRGKYIHEKLTLDGPFSERIGSNIFQRYDDDEVVLCLNYDGKFGLNNINLYFQANNKNTEHKWLEWSYKKGDPILFNESKRFSVFYNNLKGRIFDIKKDKNSITFTVDIERVLTENNCRNEVQFVKNFDGKTRVKFSVFADGGGTTDEEKSKLFSVVPFQLAYAVSIHKAQGLEYNSVKVIIPESNTEKITHSIFYTAISRAKKHLKIYWSPETMEKVISDFGADRTDNLSLEIIKNKLKEN